MKARSRIPQPTSGRRVSRRSFLQAGLAAGAVSAVSRPAAGLPKPRRRIVVVGAGAFGGWTALYLLRRGAQVTLVDAWGPGNPRSSSSGSTRVIRGVYGADRIYTRLAARALELWVEHQSRWRRPIYYPTGAIWMAGKNDAFLRAAVQVLGDARLPFEQVTVAEARKRWPQINYEDVEWVLHERKAGHLHARHACTVVADAFIAEGGEYRQSAASAGPRSGGELASVILSDGSALSADEYVFACGPWLGKLFPDVLGDRIRATRQEVFFFGAPAADRRFDDTSLPVWIDYGEKIFYGVPGNRWRGFKIADDTRGDLFDPTAGERTPSPEGLATARRRLEFRFPGMKAAPLVGAEVCQYENSPDGHFILDRHPAMGNLWLVGGGSGHGFKHGPALGELAAAIILGQRQPETLFQLARFG